MSNEDLYAASCTPGTPQTSPSLQSCRPEHQATTSTISRPGYSHLASYSTFANDLAGAAAGLPPRTPSRPTPPSNGPTRPFPLADRRPTPPEWQVWHKPRDGFPLHRHKAYCHPHPPSPRSDALLPDEASCLLHPGPSKLTFPRPGALPTVREEIEPTENPLLRGPAPQYAGRPFPETSIEMLAAVAQRTLTACHPGSTPFHNVGTITLPPSPPS